MAVILGVPCYLYSKPSGPHSARGACNQRLPLQAYTAPPTGGRPYGWRLATLGPVRQRGPKPATASGRGSPTAEAFMEDFAVPGGAEHSKVGGRAGTSSEAMAGARGVSTVHSGHIRQMFTAGPRLTVTVMGPGRAPPRWGGGRASGDLAKSTTRLWPIVGHSRARHRRCRREEARTGPEPEADRPPHEDQEARHETIGGLRRGAATTVCVDLCRSTPTVLAQARRHPPRDRGQLAPARPGAEASRDPASLRFAEGPVTELG
jgi:hypothetical protein